MIVGRLLSAKLFGDFFVAIRCIRDQAFYSIESQFTQF